MEYSQSCYHSNKTVLVYRGSTAVIIIPFMQLNIIPIIKLFKKWKNTAVFWSKLI